MSDLRFPIGPFVFDQDAEVTPTQRGAWIEAIAIAPGRLREAVRGLSDARLDTPYRPSGWTVRQVVHHLPDSHLNAYLRLKLALTEDTPTIKPYDEARWAELPDSRESPEVSLALLDALHQRWVALLRSLGPADFSRTFYHPESKVRFTLDRQLAMYAWHGRHHVAHISSLRAREGWA